MYCRKHYNHRLFCVMQWRRSHLWYKLIINNSWFHAQFGRDSTFYRMHYNFLHTKEFLRVFAFTLMKSFKRCKTLFLKVTCSHFHSSCPHTFNFHSEINQIKFNSRIINSSRRILFAFNLAGSLFKCDLPCSLLDKLTIFN